MEAIKQPGQTWIMRNGQEVTIDAIVETDPHPVKSGEHLCWQSNGRYWDDEFDHKMDLITLKDEP